MSQKPCFVFGGILKALFTMKFFHKTKPLIQMYCPQLSNLAEKLKNLRPELANRKGVMFQQDNGRPHVSLATQTRLHELGWDLLLHAPHSPDIVHLTTTYFCVYQTHCKEKALLI